MGIPPSFIPTWINDLLCFFSHSSRQDGIIYSPSSQNESHKQSNSIVSTNSNPKPILPASQLTYPYNTEKPELTNASYTNEETADDERTTRSQSRGGKYLMGHLNMSVISKISSYIDTKKKECVKLEEGMKMLQNTEDKLRSQIDRSRALRDYVVIEEQFIMEMYTWCHKLKNSLMENYNISIDDAVHEFARVTHEFSKSGYDSNYILKEFFEIKSMELEKKVLGDEIRQLKDNKRSLESTLKFYELIREEDRETMKICHQLKEMGFGLDRLKILTDTLLRIARIKKQSIKEVSKEFVNDIHRYYY